MPTHSNGQSRAFEGVSRPAAAALTLALLAAAGCSKDLPEFEEVPPAEELFADGQKLLEGERLQLLAGVVEAPAHGQA